MYKIKYDDNIFIFTDGSNHDDYIAIQMAIKLFKNIKGIVISGGAYGNPGASLTIYTNFLRKFNREDIKIYIGPLKSLFDEENDYSDTFSRQVSKKTLFYIDQLFGANYLIPNYGPNKIRTNYVEDVLATPSPVLLCLGHMTPLIPVAQHAKFIYMMGGRFNPPDISESTPPSNYKANASSSSNIYADPLAAQRVLEIAGEKIAWLFSDAARSIPVSEESLKELHRITHDGNRCSMKIIKQIYRTMIDTNEAYPVSDASLIILALHPEYFNNITLERILINTGVSLDISIDRNNATTSQTITYSLGIGGMDLSEEGYLTYLVRDPSPERVLRKYYEILCLDDCKIKRHRRDRKDKCKDKKRKHDCKCRKEKECDDNHHHHDHHHHDRKCHKCECDNDYWDEDDCNCRCHDHHDHDKCDDHHDHHCDHDWREDDCDNDCDCDECCDDDSDDECDEDHRHHHHHHDHDRCNDCC